MYSYSIIKINTFKVIENDNNIYTITYNVNGGTNGV